MIKTVSLETAKALKEAGFRQDDIDFHLVFCTVGTSSEPRWICYRDNVKGPSGFDCIPVPTTDELLEELPCIIQFDQEVGLLRLNIYRFGTETGEQWGCFYSLIKNIDHFVLQQTNESLPEALAQMWLWLKKEGLIK